MGSVVGVDACTWRSHVTGGRNLIPTEHGRWQKGEPMEKVKNYKYLHGCYSNKRSHMVRPHQTYHSKV